MTFPNSTQYKVVINHEEQYTVIPVSQSIPSGYRTVGLTGSKEECLAYVKKAWKTASPEDWRKLISRLK